MSEPDTSAFYDELSAYYDLIYVDWEATMRRQGEAILALFESQLPGAERPLRVLDAAAGIGTQSLPLAQRGCALTSRDLSSAAIERLRREASARGLELDAGVADMRAVDRSVSGAFDAVLAFDNAVAHLLTDEDMLATFRAFFRALRPGGVCLLSARDYDKVQRGVDQVQTYGVRWRDGKRYLPLQAWRWLDDDHYDGTFYFVVDEPSGPRVRCATARYYAFSLGRLAALLGEAGFQEVQRIDDAFFQPALSARRPP